MSNSFDLIYIIFHSIYLFISSINHENCIHLRQNNNGSDIIKLLCIDCLRYAKINYNHCLCLAIISKLKIQIVHSGIQDLSK